MNSSASLIALKTAPITRRVGMLELRGISIILGDFSITDLNLELGEGEYFVLLGPSGAGKTVLLELIAGLYRPEAGQVFFDGEDVTSLPPERRPFSLVYQDYALFPHLDVAANIAYGPRVRGVERSEIDRRCEELLNLLDITALSRRRVTSLSGGEKQRVALARALAVKPRLLLLDEPLSALDANIRRRLRRELRGIHRESGAAFLHVTHDREEAMVLADRVGVMLDRGIRQVAAPLELFHSPSDVDVTRFLDMPNVMSVNVASDGLCRVAGREIHVASAAEGVSHIWIRPEEILLSRAPFDSSARNQFRGVVADWEPADTLFLVRIDCEGLVFESLLTHASFTELGIASGAEVFATFKSSAVHCF